MGRRKNGRERPAQLLASTPEPTDTPKCDARAPRQPPRAELQIARIIHARQSQRGRRERRELGDGEAGALRSQLELVRTRRVLEWWQWRWRRATAAFASQVI